MNLSLLQCFKSEVYLVELYHYFDILRVRIIILFYFSFHSVKGPELINMYVGQSEQNVRDGKYNISAEFFFFISMMKVHCCVY